jgi:hypothetical protein
VSDLNDALYDAGLLSPKDMKQHRAETGMTDNKNAYYARPISIDGTKQEARDKALIEAMGFVPYPVGPDKEKALEQYREVGMDAFMPYVLNSAVLIFRAFPDGSIGAGVAKEIAWAQLAGIPVVEIPRQIARRTLGVDATRDMLAELGQR